jgi:acyl carrier protein
VVLGSVIPGVQQLLIYKELENIMTKVEFYNELINQCDLSADEIADGTNIKDIDGYDSLAVMTMIAFIDEKFNVKLSGKQFSELSTLYSLAEKIGLEKFQDA